MGKAAIIYWSGTGTTEAMAQSIGRGMKEAGADVDLFSVSDAGAAGAADRYEQFAFGCPSMGSEVLEEGEFEPFFTAIEGKLAAKKVALFGSYGWGDGQWMRDWQERARKAGADLFEEGFIAQESANEDAAAEFGKRFACY
ncbi:MAG: flavodoxin [Clostridiales Family XIII bacterium]|jgi:flavodoxin short chain|nr:flavodoxin [Clostridiales Family XIII bacterium]